MTSELIADLQRSIVYHHENDCTSVFVIPAVNDNATKWSRQVSLGSEISKPFDTHHFCWLSANANGKPNSTIRKEAIRKVQSPSSLYGHFGKLDFQFLTFVAFFLLEILANNEVSCNIDEVTEKYIHGGIRSIRASIRSWIPSPVLAETFKISSGSKPNTFRSCSLTPVTFAFGKSILFNVGIIASSAQNARLKFATVCACKVSYNH